MPVFWKKTGSAEVLLEEDSSGQALFQAMCRILRNSEKRSSMERAMAQLGIRDATERILEVIQEITKEP